MPAAPKQLAAEASDPTPEKARPISPLNVLGSSFNPGISVRLFRLD